MDRIEQDEYVSNDDGISDADLTQVTSHVTLEGFNRNDIPVYLVDMASGERTPILAVMLDTEGDDAPNLYLYTEVD